MRGQIGIGLAVALALGAAAGSAGAHAPYLLPNTFDASGRDHVTVEAAVTEHYFIPEFAIRSEGFHAIGPDGVRVALTPVYTKDVTLLELPTTANGTWRISSGDQMGRPGKAAMVNGQLVFQKGPPPEGAVLVDVQGIMRSEVYVSRGAPNDAALKPTGQGLEFQAVTHPDKISVGEPARFIALLDGKPLAGQSVVLTRGDDLYSDDKPLAPLVTDVKGAFTVTPGKAGVYHAVARCRQPPAAPGAPAKNLTYALTFEAVK